MYTQIYLNFWYWAELLKSQLMVIHNLKLTKVFLFSGIKVFFTAHVLCGLALFTLKTKGQTIWTENLPEKFQNWNQNSG